MTTTPKRHDPHQDMKRADFELQYKRDIELHNVELHHHDFYEVYFLISGDVTYTIESKLYRVLPGDLLLISPRELHQIYICPERSAYERYVLWVDPKILRRLSTDQTDLLACLDPSHPGYRNQLRLTPERQQRIHRLMSDLYEELQQTAFGSDILPELLLTELLITINRLAEDAPVPEAELTGSGQLVSQVVDYISTHYEESLSLESLADRFYVSKYHLSHEFNRLVGTSVHRYILKKRLLIARELLSQGGKPNAVWNPCGFGDYTGFYRAFKAEYGTSPREYVDAIHS